MPYVQLEATRHQVELDKTYIFGSSDGSGSTREVILDEPGTDHRPRAS